MSQATLDYIHGRIVTSDFSNTGEIVTTCKVTFDNGMYTTGTSIRDINNFDKEEAQKAACDNAIKVLSPGVEFILTKTA